MSVVCKRLPVCECASFCFGSEGGVWNLIVLVSDHLLSFDFTQVFLIKRDGINLPIVEPLTGVQLVISKESNWSSFSGVW